MTRARLRALAATAAGVVLLGTSLTALLSPSAGAATGSPQDFLFLGLSADAGGERVVATQKATTQPDGFAEFDVPFAHTELNTSKSYALTSAAWPGTGVGNLGGFIVLVGGPPQAAALKDPVRAEAFSNQGPNTVTQAYPSGSTPGITMTASALAARAAAHSEMAGSDNASVGVFGPTEVATETAVTGTSTARSTASAAAKNMSIGPGGLIRIASVVSTATVTVTATTTGTTATPKGGTTVEGMTVAGFPVTVDEQGVHAQGHGVAATAANQQINKALAQTQTQVFLAAPTTTRSPSGTTFDAGSLYISLGDGQLYIQLGGATAIAGASNITTTTAPAGPPPVNGPPPAVTTPTVATGNAPSVSGPGTVPAPQTAPTQTGGEALRAAVARFPGTGLAPGWLVAALLGAALIAVGLRRLPDRLLEQAPATCPLGENT